MNEEEEKHHREREVAGGKGASEKLIIGDLSGLLRAGEANYYLQLTTVETRIYKKILTPAMSTMDTVKSLLRLSLSLSECSIEKYQIQTRMRAKDETLATSRGRGCSQFAPRQA